MDAIAAPSFPEFDFDRLNLPRFTERSPWHGGDLQTLANVLAPDVVDLSPFELSRIEAPAMDDSGDRLVASWHRPVRKSARRPLAVLIHGLTGDEESVYVRRTARYLLAAEFPVLRLNLRGAGVSRQVCRGHYNAGSSEDLAALLAGLPMRAIDSGIVAVGFSLGGSLLLKYLGEAGLETRIRAAVTVSTPLDLTAASRRLAAPRNLIYHGHFLNELRRSTLARGPDLTTAERHAVMTARSLREFDDRYIAPRSGYDGAADYYARCSAANFLDWIAVPTLLIQSEDDPIVPAENYHTVDWRRNRLLTPLIQQRGGHVGFHDRQGGTWYDRAICRFFERVLNLN